MKTAILITLHIIMSTLLLKSEMNHKQIKGVFFILFYFQPHKHFFTECFDGNKNMDTMTCCGLPLSNILC